MTWIALVLVPPGCALALGWAAHGARPWMARSSCPCSSRRWSRRTIPRTRREARPDRRLVRDRRAPVRRRRALALLKAGVFAMATIDAVFIFGDFFGEQNAQFNAAAPPTREAPGRRHRGRLDGLRRLLRRRAGRRILAAEGRPQAIAALATFAVAQAFNQLFLVVDSLPGTVPPALVLLAFELVDARRVAKSPVRC